MCGQDGGALTWCVGHRYFIGRVMDWHPEGVIVKLSGKLHNIPWEFFGDREWHFISAEDVRRFVK